MKEKDNSPGKDKKEDKQRIPNENNSSTYPLIKDILHAPNASIQNTANQEIIKVLFKVVQEQTFTLQHLVTKVSLIANKTQQLSAKIQTLKRNSIGTPVKVQSNKLQEKNCKIQQKALQKIDSETLMRIVFGQQQYHYKLELTENMQLPLYRQRNFSISLQLKDSKGNLIQNQNKIPLSLAIYNCENPPKFLQANTVGQKMVKGFTEKSLQFGTCHFQKIQIREVTSHFRNGWVFIVIIPLMTPLGCSNSMNNFIDYREIQPLVLDKIVVKAKKIKETKQKDIKKSQAKFIDKSDQNQSDKQSYMVQNQEKYLKFQQNEASGSLYQN